MEPAYIPAKAELAIAQDIVVLVTKKLHCTCTVRSWTPFSLHEMINAINELLQKKEHDIKQKEPCSLKNQSACSNLFTFLLPSTYARKRNRAYFSLSSSLANLLTIP